MTLTLNQSIFIQYVPRAETDQDYENSNLSLVYVLVAQLVRVINVDTPGCGTTVVRDPTGHK